MVLLTPSMSAPLLRLAVMAALVALDAILLGGTFVSFQRSRLICKKKRMSETVHISPALLVMAVVSTVFVVVLPFLFEHKYSDSAAALNTARHSSLSEPEFSSDQHGSVELILRKPQNQLNNMPV
ncbi:MAG TPA: hypothetical protein VFN35_29115 [Ktedonobacteraceae bacterium]|nr:hypothetical protein [Ktedonobacteraceae bacterium]